MSVETQDFRSPIMDMLSKYKQDQCQALTKGGKGPLCSKNVIGSKYCAAHKNNHEVIDADLFQSDATNNENEEDESISESHDIRLKVLELFGGKITDSFSILTANSFVIAIPSSEQDEITDIMNPKYMTILTKVAAMQDQVKSETVITTPMHFYEQYLEEDEIDENDFADGLDLFLFERSFEHYFYVFIKFTSL